MKTINFLHAKYIALHLTLLWFLLFSLSCSTAPNITATYMPSDTNTPAPTNTPNPTITSTATLSPILPGDILFAEDFENGEPQGFSSISGDWHLVDDGSGNMVYELGKASGHDAIIFNSDTWADYAVEYRVRMMNANAYSLLNFRLENDSSGTYVGSYVEYLGLQNQAVSLIFSFMNEGWKTLTSHHYNITQGVWYNMRVEAQGENLRIYINGDLEIETTDSRYPAGGFNLGGNYAQFDDIRVTALSEIAVANACVVAPDNLVGWWPAEGNAQDLIAGNDGVLNGGTSFVAGKVGQAFRFNGVNGSVDIPRSASLDVGQQVTVEFWMKPAPGNPMHNCCQGLVGTDYYLVEILDWTSSVSGVSIDINTGNGFKHTAEDLNATYQTPVDKWSYIVGTYDGTRLNLFVNGKLEAQVTYQGTIIPMLTTSFLSIGSEDGRTNCSNCIGTRYFNGLIDEVSIYNRALSESEIQSIFSADQTGKCSLPN